ncbi:MAG: hypothetical protein QOC83_2134, partial [Pseudonocardiales bacterium]|nr:hypothetical protein [Pseudonocardiales bacterium]
DWSRYIPAATPPSRLLWATVSAQLATLVPILFGVLTATLTVGRGDYVFTLLRRGQLAADDRVDRGAVVGLMFANYPPLVVGPLHDVAGGIEISLPVSLALAAATYLVSLWVAPEPRYAFGPTGPRWVPVRDGVPPPITDDTGASTHRVARRA